MPSFEELSKDYAQRVADALRQDSFTKAASITESTIRYSRVVEAFKEIGQEVRRLRKPDGEPLTQSERDEILEGAGRRLNLPDPGTFSNATKRASNDSYMELVNDIADIVRTKPK
jgi:hypothetical protein